MKDMDWRPAVCLIMLICSSIPAFAADSVCARMQAKKAQTGRASWYAPALEGRPTSSGEPYRPQAMTAAHPSLPLGTKVRVTNRRNGLSAILRINDRGPYTGADVIDLSEAAAAAIGAKATGHALVRIRVLCPTAAKN